MLKISSGPGKTPLVDAPENGGGFGKGISIPLNEPDDELWDGNQGRLGGSGDDIALLGSNVDTLLQKINVIQLLQ